MVSPTDPFEGTPEEAQAPEILPPAPAYTPTMAAVNESIASMQESMEQYDAVTISTLDIRQQLLGKLLPTAMAMNMEVDRHTDPDLYAAQTKLFGEVRQILNDMDSSAQKHVATKMKQKDQENDEKNMINTAELLKHISLHQIPTAPASPQITEAEAQKKLDDKFEKDCRPIPDTELIASDSQLPERKVSEEL